MSAKNVIFFVDGYPYTGELAKRVREMSSQLCITLYTLSKYVDPFETKGSNGG